MITQKAVTERDRMEREAAGPGKLCSGTESAYWILTWHRLPSVNADVSGMEFMLDSSARYQVNKKKKTYIKNPIVHGKDQMTRIFTEPMSRITIFCRYYLVMDYAIQR